MAEQKHRNGRSGGDRSQKVISDVFGQAADAFDVTIRNGIEMQERAARWWSDLFSDTGSLQSIQRDTQSAVAEAVPTVQHAVEESLQVFDQSCRSAMEVMKRALEAGKAGSISEMQAKTQQLWETSLNAFRNSTQSMVEASARAMELWTNFGRRSAETMTEVATRAGRAAQAGLRSAQRGAGHSSAETVGTKAQTAETVTPRSRGRRKPRRAAAKA